MSDTTLVPTKVLKPGEEPPSEEEAAAIAIAEKTTLAQDEEVIGRGLGTFLEVGTALNNIRIAKKYKASYPTFEEYLRFRWDISSEYAYQTIDASKDIPALPPATPKPINMGQARALHKVPEVWRADVMVEAASGDHLTARVIDTAFDTIAVRAAGEITMRPVIQYLVDDLHVACGGQKYPAARQIRAMARHYKHPEAGELDRIRASEEIREDTASLRLTPEEWLMRRAILELNAEKDRPLRTDVHDSVPWMFGNDTVALKEPMKNPKGLKWNGKWIGPSAAAREKRKDDAEAKKEAASKPPADPAAVWRALPEGQQKTLCEMTYWRDLDGSGMEIFDRTLRGTMIRSGLITEDGDTFSELTPAGIAVAAQAPPEFYAGVTEELREEDEDEQPPSQDAPPPQEDEHTVTQDEQPPPPPEEQTGPPEVPQGTSADTVIAANVVSSMMDYEIYCEKLTGRWDFTDSSAEQVATSVEDLKVVLDTIKELAAKSAAENSTALSSLSVTSLSSTS